VVQLKVGPDDVVPIASIAASLRRRAQQVEPAYSTRQIIDACFPGTFVTGRVIPAHGVHDLVAVDEKAFRSHRAPHLIVYRRGLSTGEQRYAIAHALGHIIFDGANHEGCVDFNRERELRCDRFADELLVPLEELRPYVGAWPTEDPVKYEVFLDMVDQIASHFHVPAAVIMKQISRLADCPRQTSFFE
jgi:Zn-dependent peptidase ImmA (M78 family)